MTKLDTHGTCIFCGKSFTRRGMSKHLATYKARLKSYQQAAAAEHTQDQLETLFHIRVAGTYAKLFWMHLEIPGSMTLMDLDRFLRQTWLECCGHLSMFRIGNVHYHFVLFENWGTRAFRESLPAELRIELQWPEERDMDIQLKEGLTPGLSFYHEYDFGTTTDLTLQVIDQREGYLTEEPDIQVMVRNDPPDLRCDCCGKPATSVCTQCIWGGEEAWLCESCAAKHACGVNMLLPVVNSPRVGMCAYTGEDEWDAADFIDD